MIPGHFDLCEALAVAYGWPPHVADDMELVEAVTWFGRANDLITTRAKAGTI